jgi:precorrin-4 methylase
MMRNTKAFWLAIILLLLTASVWAEDSPTVSITGQVRHPLHVSVDDLSKLGDSRVRLNEVFKDGSFHGVFSYEGAPLRTILKLAEIEKTDNDFSKAIDLALVVRNSRGEEAVLSWGEIFYRNPDDVILATSASPIIPHVSCDKCHEPEEYKPWRDQLTRTVGLPKLVIADDFHNDRCLESVTAIEVVDLRPPISSRKMDPLFSPAFTVTGQVEKEIAFDDLSSFPHKNLTVKQAGDGRGYHGLKRCGGVPLTHILEHAGIEHNMCSAILVSAPDGYRSLLSYGELFLSSFGDDVLIADTAYKAPIQDDGKFILVPPRDLAADRWVKAVEKIEVLDLRNASRLYVIGVGCGGADLITLEAISALAKADVLVCPNDLHERFGAYLGGKQVLFDPIASLERIFHKGDKQLDPKERQEHLAEQRAMEAGKVVDALAAGKSVAYLDYGDPMVFGSWRFLSEYIDPDKMEFIPGISSFNAANSLLKRDITCNGSVAITAPQDLEAKETLIQSIAESGDTLAIFMGLKDLKNLMPLFLKHYPGTTPVSLVYEAGYSGRERVIRTTLAESADVATEQREKWLGIIYIGECLEVKSHTDDGE